MVVSTLIANPMATTAATFSGNGPSRRSAKWRICAEGLPVQEKEAIQMDWQLKWTEQELQERAHAMTNAEAEYCKTEMCKPSADRDSTRSRSWICRDNCRWDDLACPWVRHYCIPMLELQIRIGWSQWIRPWWVCYDFALLVFATQPVKSNATWIMSYLLFKMKCLLNVYWLL